MYSVPSELYVEVVARLREAIGERRYFSGTLNFAFGEVECHLRASLMVYWREESYPERHYASISDLVLVWWEMHTTIDGEEKLNDFSFSTLRQYL